MGKKPQCSVLSQLIWTLGVISTGIFSIDCFRTEDLKCDQTLCQNGNCYRTTNSMIIGPEMDGYFLDCPKGFDKYQGRCFKVTLDRKSWFEAYMDTGHLAKLLTKEDARISADYLHIKLPESKIPVWTGGLVDSTSTQLRWVPEGSPVTWYGTESLASFLPLDNNSCLALGPMNYTYWDVLDCTTELYYLVTADLVPRTLTNNDFMCRCHQGYTGETCDTSDSSTRELTNPHQITCTNGTLIFVEFALYEYAANGSNITDCAAPNTLALLRYLCQGKNTCKLEPLIIKPYFINICNNTNATLAVRYSCQSPNDMTCPSEMIQMEGKESVDCVLVTDPNVSWNEAMKFCLVNGGQLAAFDGNLSLAKLSEDPRVQRPLTSFWLFDQLANIRPDNRRPVECTMAIVDVQSKQPKLQVVKDCSQNLPGICAFPALLQRAVNNSSASLHPTPVQLQSLPKTMTRETFTITDTVTETGIPMHPEIQMAISEGILQAATTPTIRDSLVNESSELTTGTVSGTMDIIFEANGTTTDETTDANETITNITDTMTGPTKTMLATTKTTTHIPTAKPENTFSSTARNADNTRDTVGTNVSTSKTGTPDTTTLQSTPPSNCSKKHYGGLVWPPTFAGNTVKQPCIEGQNGYVTWTCLANGQFDPNGPDFSHCNTAVSVDITKLSNNLANGAHPDVVVTDLAATLQAAVTMASGDVINAVNLIDRAIAAQQESLQGMTDAVGKEETMSTFTVGIVNSTGALLAPKHLTSWFGLNENDRGKNATQLLVDVDLTGILYGSVLTNSTRSEFKYDTLLQLYVEARNTTDNTHLELPHVTVPSEAITIAAKPDSAILPIVATTFNTIGQVMPIGDHFHSFSNVTQVIGASFNETIKLERDKVIVFIEKPSTSSIITTSLCVYWNESDSRWSSEGCELGDGTNDTHFMCECDHMTSFAVLMSLHPELVNGKALNIITIVGCSISIVCLVACIVSFVLVRSLRKFWYKVHLHLCISLMIADIILITAHFYKTNQDDDPVDALCTVLAMLLHYFYLATFMWMCMEGVQIYLALVRVFAPRKKRGYLYFLAAYGIPGVVVGISGGVNIEGYGSATDCFLNADSGLMWGFLAFVLATIIFNTVLLILSLRSAARLKNTQSTRQAHSAKKWLLQLIIIHPLLGLTWVFGFLQFGDQLVFSYLFTILNSLQGMFIFLFHVFRNDAVKQYFTKKIPYYSSSDTKPSRNQALSSSGQTEDNEKEYFGRNQKDFGTTWSRDIPGDTIRSNCTDTSSNGFLNLQGNLTARYVIPRAKLSQNGTISQNGYNSCQRL